MSSDVPSAYSKLVKSVVYTFYNSLHIAIISLLVYHNIIDEDSLIELLRVDKKQFRSAVLNLRSDRLVKQLLKKDKDVSSGQLSTYIFYHINYLAFLNAVRYKLEKIRKSLIIDEKVSISSAMFLCQNCGFKYYDIDIPRILDMESDKMTCYNCSGDVVENVSDTPVRTNKCMTAKFHEQFDVFFRMIEECNACELPPNLTDVEITEDLLQRAIYARNNQDQIFSSFRNRIKTDNTINYLKLSDQSIQINIGESKQMPALSKPQPQWLKNEIHQQNILTKSNDNQTLQQKVLQQLVLHEMPAEEEVLSSSGLSSEEEKAEFDDGDIDEEFTDVRSIKSLSCASELNEQILEADLFDSSPDRMPKVKINDQLISIEDIDDDMISKMNEAEHQNYINILNELYKNI